MTATKRTTKRTTRRVTTLAPVAVAVAVAAGVAACGSDSAGDHGGHGRHEHGGHDDHADHADHADDHADDLLRIDREMLRDLRITTATVDTRAAGETMTALGELAVNEEAYAEVGSPVPARVVRVLAGPGDTVTAGQALAVLHSPQLGVARADYAAAQSRAELARKTLDRERALAADRIVPEKELQQAEAAAASADAQVRAARAALATFGAGPQGGDPSRIALPTPIAGTVIERTAILGRLTDGASPLFRVGDLSTLWLTVHAFERDAVRLRPGAQAKIAFPALPGQTFEGKLTLIGREVERSSRTIPVRVEVANPDGVLRPGMSASATIPLGDAGATVVAVPAVAVHRVEDSWSVFIPRGEGAFEVRPIGRGRELGGAVEVLTGLEPGETIVVEGAFLLKAEMDKAHGAGGHDH